MHSAKTVQILLPSGDATGLRRASITTSTLAVYDVPRTRFSEFALQPEADRPALLIGLAEDARGDVRRLAIATSTEAGRQLHADTWSAQGWSRVLIALSTTNKFTKAHFELLCSLMRDRLAEPLRGERECNDDERPVPAPEWLEAECNVALDSIALSIATLGFKFLRGLQPQALGLDVA